MGAYTRTYSLTDGTTAYGSQVAFELDALGSSVNNIVNAQIANGAAIADSKLAQLTTASKVALSALVQGGTGQLILSGGGTAAWGAPAEPYALPGSIVQMVTHEIASVVTCATTGTTYDDSIPAITDGVEILTKSITPLNSNNLLLFIITGQANCDSGANHTLHLHKDGGAAKAAGYVNIDGVGSAGMPFLLSHSEVAGGTSSQTWSVRLNPSSGGNTSYVNSTGGGTRYAGGVASTKLTIFEIKV